MKYPGKVKIINVIRFNKTQKQEKNIGPETVIILVNL
jgi:hypothetical protein